MPSDDESACETAPIWRHWRDRGQQILSQGLAQGHAITAFARNPASLSPAASLTIVQGDIVDAAAVERAVSGQDVLLDEYRCRGVSLLY